MAVIAQSRLKMAVKARCLKEDWMMLVVSSVFWPLTAVAFLLFFDFRKSVAICSRCHGEIEDIEHVQSGEDYVFGIVCECCLRQLQDGEGDDYET